MRFIPRDRSPYEEYVIGRSIELQDAIKAKVRGVVSSDLRTSTILPSLSLIVPPKREKSTTEATTTIVADTVAKEIGMNAAGARATMGRAGTAEHTVEAASIIKEVSEGESKGEAEAEGEEERKNRKRKEYKG